MSNENNTIRPEDRDDLIKVIRNVRTAPFGVDLSDLAYYTGLPGTRIRNIVIRYGNRRFAFLYGKYLNYLPATGSFRKAFPAVVCVSKHPNS